MLSKAKKHTANPVQRKQLIATGLILSACLLILIAFMVASGLGSGSNKQAIDDLATAADESPYNESVFRESFMANCAISAKTSLSEAAADVYCNCVLDQGIAEFGFQRFVEINQEAIKTYDMSELKDLINGCLAEATT